jgi:uncharacterized protein (DUF3084 family)
MSLENLRQDRKDAQEKKKELTKKLRNASRKYARLKKRTRQIPDEELLEVLRNRKELAETYPPEKEK